MNDFTWSSTTSGIPDRLRSTSYARLQQCQSVRRLEQFAKVDRSYWGSGEAHRDLMEGLRATSVQSGGPPRANPIPQPDPERRDFEPPRWEDDPENLVKLGVFSVGATLLVIWLLLQVLRSI